LALSGSTIGIKIADGSYYPILEAGFRGRKKLTLTTVKDGQTKVQIDLYRGNGGSVEKPEYIGSLIIENIRAASRGTPDIELSIGLDDAGELSAEANDRSTGETQSFSMSLQTLAAEETYEIPEFEMDAEPQRKEPTEQPPLTGQSYPVGEADRRREPLARRGPNVFLLILFIILGLALVLVIAWFVYRSVTGSAAPAAEKPAAVSPQKPETPAAEKPAATAPSGQGQSEGGGAAASSPAEKPKPAGSVTYRIKKGDTLWDISSTYYRNPWLYPKLAKANKIRNPDLIFAGTKIVIPQE
jgi:LysM repeat protein